MNTPFLAFDVSALDVLGRAFSLAFSGGNALLSLIFSLGMVVLAGFLIAFLWGRLWNSKWTPFASVGSALLTTILLTLIFCSSLCMHSLSNGNFGMVGEYPSDRIVATVWPQKADEQKGVIQRFCESMYNVASRTAARKPAASGTPSVSDTGATLPANDGKKWEAIKLIARQYANAHLTCVIVFWSSIVVLLAAVGFFAYDDIKLVAPSVTPKKEA